MAVRGQLVALDALNHTWTIERSIWRTRGRSTQPPASSIPAADERAPALPGGVAPANAVALARVSRLLTDGFGASYETVRPRLDSLRQAVRDGRLKPPVGVTLRPEAFASAGPRGLSPLDVGLIYD